MKKISIFVLIFMSYAVSGFAADVYVRSVRAKIFAKPSFKSEIIEVATRGETLATLKKQGKWIKVDFSGKTGWVSKYLVSNSPPMKRVSLLAGGKSLQKSSRRRASAFTSVAAARGLSDYDRARRGQKGYMVDFDALERMEGINIDEDEAVKFIEAGVSR